MAIDITAEPQAESAEDLAARFAALAVRWMEECRHTSKIKTMKECPAYREIVGMGETVVPLILARLETAPSFLFLALGEITKINPVPKESAGKIDEMIAAWIAWGRANGYRWENAV